MLGWQVPIIMPAGMVQVALLHWLVVAQVAPSSWGEPQALLGRQTSLVPVVSQGAVMQDSPVLASGLQVAIAGIVRSQ